MKFDSWVTETDTNEIINSEFMNWGYFKNSTVLVTGATGLIGYQIVLALLLANEKLNTDIKVIALVRNKLKAAEKFKNYKKGNLKFIIQDITEPIHMKDKVDYIIHTANGTSSRSFVEQPVETINSIILGTKNILKFAKDTKVKGLVYLSSMEVYGITDSNKTEPLKENEYGYIDLQSARSSYSEGKRLAENMCYCYCREYQVPVKIARLCQIIGTGIEENDNRVFAQFARSVAKKQDIVLHTTGKTIRNYCYITEAIVAIFILLEKGVNGEVYNIANPDTSYSIRQIAEMLCEKYTDSNIKFVYTNDNSYFPATRLSLDISKMKDLGWQAQINLMEMFDRLISGRENV